MAIEVISKIVQKNNGTFKLVDAVNVDYDGTGTSNVKDKIDNLNTNKADKTALDTTNNNVSLKADKTYVDTQVQSVASGSPKGVYTYLTDLQTAHPTGDTNIYLVTGNIAEIDTLNVTTAPTSSGNVTITLNGATTNVAVTSGVAEVASLTISAIPTTAGNVTVTLNGVATNVAVDPATDTTISAVATKIRNTTFTGWTTGGTGSTITFTANAVGSKTDTTYSAGSTGATGTMSTTTQGVDADTTTIVATKIRGASFSGWTTGGTGTTVTFTKTTVGTNTAPTFNAGTTGSAATFTVTTKGANPDGNWYYWNGSVWTAGGVYQSTRVEKHSIKLESLSPDLFSDTVIQSGIEANFSNARTYENSYPMKFVYTIPEGITLNTITAKCKFKTDSSNITQARLKLLVGTDPTISANLTIPSFTSITSGVETELIATRSNSDTGFTNITVFVYAWGSDIVLPASYLISNLELYINGNLTEYTAVLDEAYSNVDATCTFNYIDDKLVLKRQLDALDDNITNLSSSVSMATKYKNGYYLASFSNGRSYENSYPLKFDCVVTKPYSSIQAKVDVISKSSNLYRGRLKLIFNNSPSTDYANGNYSTVTKDVETNLSITATRNSIQTVSVYIFLEGTNINLASEYLFKNLKILLDGIEDNTITFTRDTTYGATDITSLTVSEEEGYILTDNQNNLITLLVEEDVKNTKTDVLNLQNDVVNLSSSVSTTIKSKITDDLAQFSNGRTFENSYPLKFDCVVTNPYSTIEAKVDITSQSDNLYRGRVKIYFNNSPTDFINGNYTTTTTGVETNLSVIATRSSIQTVTVYIFIEGTDKNLPSEYVFKNLKILLDGVEDDSIVFTRDATYGASEMAVTIIEGGNYILTDWNNNPIPLTIEADVENLKIKTIDTAPSPLRGKILNMLGDSYVYGHTLTSSKVSYAKIATKYGMTYRNYGINGNCVSTVAGGSGTPMVTRYVDMDNNADYIGFVGGRNDYNMGAPIGTNSDTDPSTFKGALNVICAGLIDKYIGKKLFAITCWNVNDAMMAYSDAMLEICGRWGIPCFDASRYSAVFMRSEAFRTQYCLSSTDPSHLNELGHEYVMPKFENFIAKL